MKKHLAIFVSFFVISFFVFGDNLDKFFAQDDFILIEKFSQNSIFADIKSIFSAEGTHFRPIHNLYFLTLGNTFGKNYSLYHISALLIHAAAGYLIFKISNILVKNARAALFAAFFYLVNSSHFVSLYWISGNAVEIGFCFFTASFLSWIKGRFGLSIFLFVLSFLASEAFIFAGVVLIIYELFKIGKLKLRPQILKLTIVLALLSTVRFIYLTPKDIYNTYQFELSLKTISVIKYYLLRIMGFAEFSDDFIASLILFIFYGVLIKRLIDVELEVKKLALYIIIAFVGLFPFILLPYHLSPHYMSLSIFGLSLILALVMKDVRKVNLILCAIVLLISAVNVNRYASSHWVVVKSRIAEAYIRQMEASNKLPEDGSTIVFDNNRISTSLDAYLALGGGKALDFWFKDKNYKYCFVEFDECSSLP